ncbi:hypothetical protein [Cereibacter azotoformans]|uniref:Response regulatory domain-containing protein n=2 Tax=Cereibacter azotoformans TaxID=43057 RepID=A0A2T5JTM2_9RHOB|nr:hypothetical protein [Cereibacter azotoformans]PTR13388.1 hypothetical protein C8J28_12218 [Cereibacter azotoformans]
MPPFHPEQLMLFATARHERHADLIHFLEGQQSIVLCAVRLETAVDVAAERPRAFTTFFCDLDSYGGRSAIRPHLQRLRTRNPGLCVILMSDHFTEEDVEEEAPDWDRCLPASIAFGLVEGALAEARQKAIRRGMPGSSRSLLTTRSGS